MQPLVTRYNIANCVLPSCLVTDHRILRHMELLSWTSQLLVSLCKSATVSSHLKCKDKLFFLGRDE